MYMKKTVGIVFASLGMAVLLICAIAPFYFYHQAIAVKFFAGITWQTVKGQLLMYPAGDLAILMTVADKSIITEIFSKHIHFLFVAIRKHSRQITVIS
jgi:hypothetical protein